MSNTRKQSPTNLDPTLFPTKGKIYHKSIWSILSCLSCQKYNTNQIYPFSIKNKSDPTLLPTVQPTIETDTPTLDPTTSPSLMPVKDTLSPTLLPTLSPSKSPIIDTDTGPTSPLVPDQVPPTTSPNKQPVSEPPTFYEPSKAPITPGTPTKNPIPDDGPLSKSPVTRSPAPSAEQDKVNPNPLTDSPTWIIIGSGKKPTGEMPTPPKPRPPTSKPVYVVYVPIFGGGKSGKYAKAMHLPKTYSKCLTLTSSNNLV